MASTAGKTDFLSEGAGGAVKQGGSVYARIAGSWTWRVWNVGSDLIGLKQCANLRKEGNIEVRYVPARGSL